MMINNTTKLCGLASILLLVSLAAVTYVWFDMDNKGVQLLQDMQVVKDRQLLEREYVTIQGVVDETVKDRLTLERYVLSGDDGAVAFLAIVEEIANNLNIDLTTKRLEVKETPEVGFSDLQIEFSLKGEQRSVMRMLQLFELLPYQGRVVSLSAVRKTDATTGSQIMEEQIVLQLSIIEN